jgi:hypothetical protein
MSMVTPSDSLRARGALQVYGRAHPRCDGQGEIMKTSKLGVLAASAVLGMVGSVALVQSAAADDAKACYRTHCGKSVSGHEGKCGGTKVAELKDEKSCTAAGGAWTTAADAKQYEKHKD